MKEFRRAACSRSIDFTLQGITTEHGTVDYDYEHEHEGWSRETEMPKGYHGVILRVDLTSGTIEKQSFPDDFYRTYLGGGAVGAYFLLQETFPKRIRLGRITSW